MHPHEIQDKFCYNRHERFVRQEISTLLHARTHRSTTNEQKNNSLITDPPDWPTISVSVIKRRRLLSLWIYARVRAQRAHCMYRCAPIMSLLRASRIVAACVVNSGLLCSGLVRRFRRDTRTAWGSLAGFWSREVGRFMQMKLVCSLRRYAGLYIKKRVGRSGEV